MTPEELKKLKERYTILTALLDNPDSILEYSEADLIRLATELDPRTNDDPILWVFLNQNFKYLQNMPESVKNIFIDEIAYKVYVSPYNLRFVPIELQVALATKIVPKFSPTESVLILAIKREPYALRDVLPDAQMIIRDDLVKNAKMFFERRSITDMFSRIDRRIWPDLFRILREQLDAGEISLDQLPLEIKGHFLPENERQALNQTVVQVLTYDGNVYDVQGWAEPGFDLRTALREKFGGTTTDFDGAFQFVIEGTETVFDDLDVGNLYQVYKERGQTLPAFIINYVDADDEPDRNEGGGAAAAPFMDTCL